VFGSAWGWRRAAAPPAPSVLASSSIDTQKKSIFNEGSSAMPQLTSKKLKRCGMPSLLGIVLESREEILAGVKKD